MYKTSTKPPVAIITGGSRGIGAACLQRLVDRGWRLAAVALPDENLKRWQDQSVLTIEGDITCPSVRQAVVEQTLERYQRIDVLVNNAGVGLYAAPSKVNPDLLLRLLDVNVIAAVGMAQMVIPVMRQQQSGTIINIGSVGGNVSLPWASGYCASKFALHAFTDSLHRELRKDGIRVAKVCPGIVDTDFRDHVLHGTVPSEVGRLRRVVSADSVAEAVVRLIESGYRRTVYIPQIGRLFSAMQTFAPWLMDWYLGRLSAASERPTGFKASFAEQPGRGEEI